MIEWIDDAAKGKLRAGLDIVEIDRLVLMPAQLRKLLAQRRQLCADRGRGDGFGENRQPRAAIRPQRIQLFAERGERKPTAGASPPERKRGGPKAAPLDILIDLRDYFCLHLLV